MCDHSAAEPSQQTSPLSLLSTLAEQRALLSDLPAQAEASPVSIIGPAFSVPQHRAKHASSSPAPASAVKVAHAVPVASPKVAQAVPMDLPKGVTPIGLAMWKAAVKEVMDLPQGRLAREVAAAVSSPHDAEADGPPHHSLLEGSVRGAIPVGIQRSVDAEGAARFVWPNGGTPLSSSPSPLGGRPNVAGSFDRPIAQAAECWMAELRYVGSGRQAQAPQAKKSEPSAPKYSVPTYENHWFQAPKFHSPKAVALLTGAPAPKVIAKPGAFRRRRAASHPTSLHRIDEYESESDDEPQDRAAAPELLPAPPTAVAAAAALPAAQAGVAPARSESTPEIRPLFAMTWNARHWR